MLRLYDTYKRKKVPFKSIKKNKVGMYNCGPTVYDYVTIGNLQTYVFEDVLRRTLEYFGYDVTQVMNITDVGHLTMTDIQKQLAKKKGIKLEITDTEEGLDRMEKAAKREGISVWDVAEKYIIATFGKNYKKIKEFEDDGDFGKMNIKKPQYLPRATEYIDQQIEFIKKLEKKGFTYKTNKAVYFDIQKFPEYEKLIGQSFEDMRKGKRADTSDPDRKHPADFRLWQLDQTDHAMQWDSPWGRGFPGWHIECSAMSRELLGIPFDIHTGGEDHIKVHHPAEIAQTKSAYGKTMANYWLHNIFLTVDGKRMGKSLGNAYTLEDVIDKGFDPMDLRYFYLQAHYRSKQNFSWEGLEAARNTRLKLVRSVHQLTNFMAEFWKKRGYFKEKQRKYLIVDELINNSDLTPVELSEFEDAISDDLNTPEALKYLWQLLSKNYSIPDEWLRAIFLMDRIFGLKLYQEANKILNHPSRTTVLRLIQEREDAKGAKNFHRADKIREKLEKKHNVKLEDTPDGTLWSAG